MVTLEQFGVTTRCIWVHYAMGILVDQRCRWAESWRIRPQSKEANGWDSCGNLLVVIFWGISSKKWYHKANSWEPLQSNKESQGYQESLWKCLGFGISSEERKEQTQSLLRNEPDSQLLITLVAISQLCNKPICLGIIKYRCLLFCLLLLLLPLLLTTSNY